jgi:uncharacterized membrane protein
MGKGIAVALALSLAANVFLGGFVAGKVAGGPQFHRSSQGLDFKRAGPEEFDDLSPAVRERLKRAFIAQKAKSEGGRREAHALYKELVAVLRADVWDRPAAEAIAARFEAIEKRSRADMAMVLVEAAEEMSAEDRKALAAHLERRGDRGFKHRHRRRGSRNDAPKDMPPPPPPEE